MSVYPLTAKDILPGPNPHFLRVSLTNFERKGLPLDDSGPHDLRKTMHVVFGLSRFDFTLKTVLN
jgi:hypothetical protein